ncbi:radical SAM protein [Paenibacillus macerans]|uniref:radical SAM/SPASM domain-containing protein n=1 Tax=Paenibacillus macerans TaxID=44252 RepID=UPI0018C2B3D3|nr:radical SAM protein [Paenibacillus macerans]MEC0334161.1 radical SAM protein [Paenibacillus macerans]MED4955885.1 radical SAM protein [Paenibacillus macerans]
MADKNPFDLSSNYNLKGCYVEILSNCNLRCLHCYNESGTTNEIMPLSAFKRAIDSIPSNDPESDITISGGEPLLHPDIWKFIEEVDKKNVGKSLVITNATLIDRDVAKRFATSKIGIQVSLNGSCAEVHDQLCGKGSFDRTIHGLENLLAEGLQEDIHVRFTLADFNKDDVKNFTKLMLSYGIETISIADLSISGRASDNLKSLGFSTHEKEQVKNRIAKQIQGFDTEKILIRFDNKNYTNGCPVIYESDKLIPMNFRVDAFGYVYICQAFTDELYSVGNIYRSTLSEILASREFSEFIWFCRYVTKYIPECRNCIWKSTCGQGCIANVLSSQDRISPDGDCYFRRKDYLKKFMEEHYSKIVQ